MLAWQAPYNSLNRAKPRPLRYERRWWDGGFISAYFDESNDRFIAAFGMSLMDAVQSSPAYRGGPGPNQQAMWRPHWDLIVDPPAMTTFVTDTCRIGA